MKRTPIAFLAFFASTLGCAAFAASVPVPAPPKLDARSYVLIDHDSGRVLAEHQPDARLEPASITKLMTAYAVFDAIRSGKLKLDDPVTISERAWKAEGSRTFVDVGKEVPAEVLIKGMIIQSGNDATIALAERVGGTEETFASLMNGYAKRLGMANSHFENSTGLPSPTHYMSARDIATLSSAIVREFPAYYRWYSQREFTWNKIRQENRNTLLNRDPSVDGIKTGHTETAGFCLVTSAKRDDMRLISVVMGTPSEKARESASQSLLNYGFSFFETRKLHDAGKPLQQVEVWKAAESPVDAGLKSALYVTVPRGELGAVKSEITVQPQLIAPIPASAKVAELRVLLGEEVVASRPLYPLHDIAEGGLWTRMIDSVLLWFE
jgi:D-alanyl-D-alanine carboxypeptidase (penicillin-binding protein 5/6)